jgi:hypothetical protein
MKRWMWTVLGLGGLLLAGCDQAAAPKANPPGTGASGKPQTVVKDGDKDTPESIKNAKPGSGLGAGGGDGQGRTRNPELAGKAGHDRGSKKKAEESKEAAKPESKEAGKGEASKADASKAEAPKSEPAQDAGKSADAKKN